MLACVRTGRGVTGRGAQDCQAGFTTRCSPSSAATLRLIAPPQHPSVPAGVTCVRTPAAFHRVSTRAPRNYARQLGGQVQSLAARFSVGAASCCRSASAAHLHERHWRRDRCRRRSLAIEQKDGDECSAGYVLV